MQQRTALPDYIERLTHGGKGIVFIIVLLSLLLRLPFLTFPPRTMFDESLISNFVVFTLHATPYFDLHPEFIKMLYTSIASMFSFSGDVLPFAINSSFGDFPFYPLRLFVALLGSCIPLLLYAIARTLGFRPIYAAIPAMAAVFDTGLIVYSRMILPDIPIVVLGFSGLLLSLLAVRINAGYPLLLSFLSGVLLGCAVESKWTALGMVATCGMLYLVQKRYKLALIFSATVITTYVVFFVLSFVLFFPNGGAINVRIPALSDEFMSGVTYPNTHNPGEVLHFIPAYHRLMFAANKQESITKLDLYTLPPYAWGTGFSSIGLWGNSERIGKIDFAANIASWNIALFSVIFLTVLVLVRLKRRQQLPFSAQEGVLLFGFYMNYLPLLLLGRPMFVYHYFSALLCAYLLLPVTLPHLRRCIRSVISWDKHIDEKLFFVAIMLVLLFFTLTAPFIYGL